MSRASGQGSVESPRRTRIPLLPPCHLLGRRNCHAVAGCLAQVAADGLGQTGQGSATDGGLGVVQQTDQYAREPGIAYVAQRLRDAGPRLDVAAVAEPLDRLLATFVAKMHQCDGRLQLNFFVGRSELLL